MERERDGGTYSSALSQKWTSEKKRRRRRRSFSLLLSASPPSLFLSRTLYRSRCICPLMSLLRKFFTNHEHRRTSRVGALMRVVSFPLSLLLPPETPSVPRYLPPLLSRAHVTHARRFAPSMPRARAGVRRHARTHARTSRRLRRRCRQESTARMIHAPRDGYRAPEDARG